jgi:small subunit ribosomal protein S20
VANTKSAKKEVRRNAARTARNRAVKSAVKTRVTRFRRAEAAGEEPLAELALTAVSALDRAASKGILHRNNAARRKARLVKRLNAATAETAEAPAPAQTGRAKPRAKAPAKSTAKTANKTTKSTRTPARPKK